MPRGGLRVLLGAFGDPGHAFPLLALGRALRARGHDVLLETWARWAPDAEREGLRFAAAPEFPVFPRDGEALRPYEAVSRAVDVTRPLIGAFAPDVVVSDILTLAPALAAELEGVPVATVIPHVDPRTEPGWPPYSMGARPPRTAVARRLWRALDPLVGRGLALGRDELNATRARLGLAPRDWVHNGISPELALVATFPQLESPRRARRPGTHVVGPLLWEPPAGDVELPPGDAPLLLVAPSTSQDPDHRLLRASLAGLAGLPVRVLATWNRRPPAPPLPVVPPNARLVEWVSYARTMPRCDLVLCHGGHGTVARALEAGCVVVAAPAAGDMNENAARLDRAGLGVRLPRRFVGPRAVRLATERALASPSYAARAAGVAAWARSHDAGARAAELVEELAARGRVG